MPTFESLAAFQRQWAKLDRAQRIAFKRALVLFIANLRDGQGFWSLTWGKDGRALFRYGSGVKPGDVHIIWEAIGTHDETYGRMR